MKFVSKQIFLIKVFIPINKYEVFATKIEGAVDGGYSFDRRCGCFEVRTQDFETYKRLQAFIGEMDDV